MKSNVFNYSLLAVGIAAVMGITTTANAAKSGPTTTGVEITNKATASYSVSGEEQPDVESNEVKITVQEQVSFSLIANNDDTAAGGTKDDDVNIKEPVAPNGFVLFRHTLTNTGNREDIYTVNIVSPDAKYDPANSTVSYVIYNADKSVNRSQNAVPYATANGQEFPLEKNQYIEFTINAKTQNNKAASDQSLTISATSKFLTASPAATVKTLTNTDSSFTRLPTFSIVKTITNALDLNNPNDTATYQIVINNDGTTTYSADATNIAIKDILPPGLVLSEALTATSVSGSSQAGTGTITTSSAGDAGFEITGVNIPAGQKVTIVFKVKKGGSGTLVPATAINHVKVTDDLDDNADTINNTLIDSTDSTDENVSTFYDTDDIEILDGKTPTTTGGDSTLPLLTISRALNLAGVTTREIAPTSGALGQVTHQTVITNNGQDVEGDTAGELTFTITDNDGDTPDAVNVVPNTVTITYDADGAGTGTPGSAMTITPTLVNGVNVYDIKTALPGGIAPTGTVTINYKVASVNAPLFTPNNSTTPTKESTTVTLKPADEGAPTPLTVTDTTTVRGLVLVKKQAIDADCTGTSVGTFVTADITGASPGQCIIYQIEAKNTSTAGIGFAITDVIISDLLSNFSNEADYVVNSATTTASAGGTYTATKDATEVTTTVATLAPQGTATMQFKVKIKTARVVTPTP